MKFLFQIIFVLEQYDLYICKMGAFDGSKKTHTDYTTEFKLADNELILEYMYLTNHIKCAFS